jgi:hypothetical protein
MATLLSFCRSNKLTSILAVVGAVAAMGATGCGLGDNPIASHVVIDTDAATPLTSGNGDGIFIDYASGGHWHLTTVCNQGPCEWKATITPQPGAALSAVSPFGLSDTDTLTANADGSITLDTSPQVGDMRGVTFDSDPGAWIEVASYTLGFGSAANLQVTSGGQTLVVPTEPADLYPSKP